MFIQQKDIRHAFVKVGIGAEKKSRIVSAKREKDYGLPRGGTCDFVPRSSGCRTCIQCVYHSDRPGAGGYTMPLPEKDEMFNTKRADASGNYGFLRRSCS